MLTLMFMALATTTAVFCLVMSCDLALERPTLGGALDGRSDRV
jgi:hypothetical protein